MRTLHLLLASAVAVLAIGLTSCGVSSVPPIPVGDFNLTISSQSLFVPIGSGAGNVQITVQPTGGFNQAVMVSLSGVPAGVTTTPPSPFTLARGGSQTVTFSAPPGTSPSVSTITVAGIARGSETSLYHSGTLSISVADPVYAYAWGGNTIAAYAVDANTGGITAIGTLATGLAGGLQFAVTPPRSHFIYFLVETGEGLSIATYSADPATGDLTLSQLIPIEASFGVTLVASPDGKFLYALGEPFPGASLQPGIIIGLQIDPATGRLTQSFSEKLPATLGIWSVWYYLVIPFPGNFAYVVTGGGSFLNSVSPTDGSLSQVSLQDTPIRGELNGVFSDPLGRALYSVGVNLGFIGCTSSVSALAIDHETGDLRPTASDFTTAACMDYNNVAFDPDGKYLYIYATDGGTLSTIYGFRLDSSSGALTNLPDSPFAIQGFSDFSPAGSAIAVEPSQGKLLLRVEGTIQGYRLASYAIDPKSGSLSRLGGPTVPDYVGDLIVVAPKN